MYKVYVKQDEILDYFQQHKERLGKMLDIVAEVLEDETEKPLVKVYLTEENGCPEMSIEQEHCFDADGEANEGVIAKQCATSEELCVSIYQGFLEWLKQYDEKIKSDRMSETEVDETDFEIVSERETELKEALAFFINTLMGAEEYDEILHEEDELTEMLDSIEAMLFQDFGYVIYRPRLIECDGKMKLVEFPYEGEM